MSREEFLIEELLTDLLDNNKLKQNLKYHLSAWKPLSEPDELIKERLFKMPVTHTFSDAVKTADNKTYFPYKEILFNKKAILSQYLRKLLDEKAPENSYQNLGKAKNFPYFVYSFLGSHDHYYSRERGEELPSPAFGVFISPDADNTKFSNSTRVDLSSPESIKDKKKEFLTSNGGRLYTAYQVANRAEHKKDFFHYAGDYEIAKRDEKYLRNCWEWKTEFHYLYKVDISYITAILWPYKNLSNPSSGTLKDPNAIKEIKKFKKENPNVVIYQYLWKPDDQELRFMFGSNIVLKSLYDKSIYPTDIEFAKIFQNEFND